VKYFELFRVSVVFFFTGLHFAGPVVFDVVSK